MRTTSKNGTIVRERDRSKPRELVSVVMLCIAVTIPVFIYVWAQVTHYQLGQEIQRMDRQRARLIEDGRKLDLERAQLTALGRVERIARDELGFVDATPVEVVALDGRRANAPKPNEVLASARPPAAASGAAEP